MNRDMYDQTTMLCQAIEAQTEILSDLIPSREEARLRLTCHALEGLCAFGGLREVTGHNAVRQADLCLAPHNAVRQADLCLALLYPTTTEEKP